MLYCINKTVRTESFKIFRLKRYLPKNYQKSTKTSLLSTNSFLAIISWTELFNLQAQQLNLQAQQLNSEAQQLNLQAQRLNSEAQQLNSEAQRLNSETQQFNSEAQRLNSEAQQLNSEAQRLNSEAQQLNSEAQQFILASPILSIFKASYPQSKNIFFPEITVLVIEY